ncbi:MAG: M16 family metallopeptidase, partial [Candidatus Rokuibacteriota bacterium]
LTLSERAFGAWEPRPAPDREITPARNAGGVRRAEDPRPIQQAYVALAWPGPVVPQLDVYAVDLLTSILGRGRSSRLNQSLKERQGLVSSIGAWYSAQREGGTITVTARASAARRWDVEAALLAEIERLRAAPVSEDERDRALIAVEAGHAFGYETAEGAARAYGFAETVWTLEFELGYLDAVRAVGREQIREAARRHLTPDRFTGVALVPRDGDGAAP